MKACNADIHSGWLRNVKIIHRYSMQSILLFDFSRPSVGFNETRRILPNRRVSFEAENHSEVRSSV